MDDLSICSFENIFDLAEGVPEVDLKDAIALAMAYGRASEAEMLTEAAGKVAVIRAGVYDNRDKYVRNIFPPGGLQTGEVGSKNGSGYVTGNSKGLPIIGFHYTFANVGTKQVIASFDPLYGKPAADAAKNGFDIVAKDGYVVGGLIVDANADNILAVKVMFVASKDGRIVSTNTYRSDWLGESDGQEPKTVAGKGETVLGTCGRKNGILVALGLVVRPAENKK